MWVFQRGGTVALKMALLMVSSLALNAFSVAQERQQIQAIVVGLTSTQHAYEVNEVLRVLPGVTMSRLDHHTSNLLMHLAPGALVDAATIRTALGPFGLALRCFQPGEVGAAPFRHIDPITCDDHPLRER